MKPLGIKSYGSIGHLPCSRMGPADRSISEGQAKIATEKARDRHDLIIVQEKLDGSNVGVCKIDGQIIALTRAGYKADTSPYKMHHVFNDWVNDRKQLFDEILDDSERICGEWLYQAHGTIYNLEHDYFVAFDIFDKNNKRIIYDDFVDRVAGNFVIPHLVSYGPPVSVDDALLMLGDYGYHGAQEKIEGAMWRVERKGAVDFLCKYVRPDKIDGKYLNGPEVINIITE